jgi:hypothetical protein
MLSNATTDFQLVIDNRKMLNCAIPTVSSTDGLSAVRPFLTRADPSKV